MPPPDLGPAPDRHDLYGLTHPGKVRATNEDHFLIARLQKSIRPLFTSVDALGEIASLSDSGAYLFVVADGVGGSSDGALASGTAVEVVAHQISALANSFYGSDVEAEHELIDRLEQALKQAHDQIVARQGGAGEAATTVTMVVLVWPRAYVLHVGDSRGYYLHGGKLFQFTRDQTMAEALLDAGTLPEEQVAQSRFGNVLTSAVGSARTFPAIGIVDFEPGDTLLLCTDGLTRHVDETALQEMLARQDSAESMCRNLLEASLNGGGKDNITVIVARLGLSPD